METIPEHHPLPPPSKCSQCFQCNDSNNRSINHSLNHSLNQSIDRSIIIRSHRLSCVRPQFYRDYPQELTKYPSVIKSHYLAAIDSLNVALQWPAWIRPIFLTVLLLCMAGWILIGIGLANSPPCDPADSVGASSYSERWEHWKHPRVQSSSISFEEDIWEAASNVTHVTYVNQTYAVTSYNETYLLYGKQAKKGNESDAYQTDDETSQTNDSQIMNSTASRMVAADDAIKDVHASPLASLLYYGLSILGMAAIMSVVAIWSSLRVMRHALLTAVEAENCKAASVGTMKSRIYFSVIACSLRKCCWLRVVVNGPVEAMIGPETFIDKVRSIENDQAALKLALATLSPSAALSLSPNPPPYDEIESSLPEVTTSTPISHFSYQTIKHPSKPTTRQAPNQSVEHQSHRVEPMDLQRILHEQAQEIVEMKRELARMREAYPRDHHDVIVNLQETDTSEPIIIMNGQRISGTTPE